MLEMLHEVLGEAFAFAIIIAAMLILAAIGVIYDTVVTWLQNRNRKANS